MMALTLAAVFIYSHISWLAFTEEERFIVFDFTFGCFQVACVRCVRLAQVNKLAFLADFLISFVTCALVAAWCVFAVGIHVAHALVQTFVDV